MGRKMSCSSRAPERAGTERDQNIKIVKQEEPCILSDSPAAVTN